MEIQLPKWLVDELYKHTDKSLQYVIRNILENTVNMEEGKEILRKSKEREKGGSI